jgi:hypothetical protein
MAHLQTASPESHKGMAPAMPADHHTSSGPPVGPVLKPQLRGPLELDSAVVKGTSSSLMNELGYWGD